jgi:glyoxylase-like metal-dependent hydrolase (beta-lactamase superfamily II)
MFFKQIKYRGDNFSYVVADDITREAVVVDPSFNAEAIVRLLRDKNLNVKYIINTHDHIDHIVDNEYIKSNFNAKIVAHKLSDVKKDVSVADGDVVNVASINIKVIHTPGHTPDSICLLVDGKLLTGDTLFVGECGRTDLPGSSPEDMYHSLHKLIELDDDVEVYPGHDYGVKPYSTIGFEKRTNYTLENRTLEEFIEFMSQP